MRISRKLNKGTAVDLEAESARYCSQRAPDFYAPCHHKIGAATSRSLPILKLYLLDTIHNLNDFLHLVGVVIHQSVVMMCVMKRLSQRQGSKFLSTDNMAANDF